MIPPSASASRSSTAIGTSGAIPAVVRAGGTHAPATTYGAAALAAGTSASATSSADSSVRQNIARLAEIGILDRVDGVAGRSQAAHGVAVVGRPIELAPAAQVERRQGTSMDRAGGVEHAACDGERADEAGAADARVPGERPAADRVERGQRGPDAAADAAELAGGEDGVAADREVIDAADPSRLRGPAHPAAADAVQRGGRERLQAPLEAAEGDTPRAGRHATSARRRARAPGAYRPRNHVDRRQAVADAAADACGAA